MPVEGGRVKVVLSTFLSCLWLDEGRAGVGEETGLFVPNVA